MVADTDRNGDAEGDDGSPSQEPRRTGATLAAMVARGALAVAILLGPILAMGSALFRPEGGDYPQIRSRTVANVVLLTVDEISPDDLALYNPELPEDAFLSEFAKLAVTVKYAYGATPASPAAAVSFLTGQLPSTHGVLDFSDRANRDLVTLGGLFDQRGSKTAAVTNLPMLSQCGLAQGFQTKVEEIGAGAQVIGDRAAGWLASRPEEYVFLWVHYHFRPAEKERRGEVFSQLLERVVSGLQKSRKYEGTFVIAGGTYGRAGGNLAVPLLVKIPKRTAVGAVRNGPCSTLDMTATLQEIFNLRTSDPLPGRSLVSPPNKPLYSGHYFGDVGALFELFAPRTRERVLGFLNHKFTMTTGPGRTDIGLYETAIDPGRKTSLVGTEQGDRVTKFFLDEINKRRQKIPAPRFPSKTMPIDPDVRSVLRGMGLVTDG